VSTTRIPTLSDGRHRGWYHIDNAVLDEYGAHIGVNGLGVYNVLARRARETEAGRVCYLSFRTIADALGIGRSTVIAAVKTLIGYGLLSCETVREPGKLPVNHYRLMPVVPVATGTGRGLVQELDQLSSPSAGLVQEMDQKSGPAEILVSEATATSPRNRAQLVQELDLNKTIKQDGENKTEKEIAPRSRGGVLLTPFEVTEEMARWAQSKGMSREFVERETEKFVNYFISTGRTMRDWTAAWRNWLLRAQEQVGSRRRA
jgi:DNA-binding Lrp family transcriptional regulator